MTLEEERRQHGAHSDSRTSAVVLTGRREESRVNKNILLLLQVKLLSESPGIPNVQQSKHTRRRAAC